MKVLCVLALLGVSVTHVQAKSVMGSDARVQIVDYASGALIRLQTAPATAQTVLFAKGERIRSAVLSVPDSYAIDLSGSGDGFVLKPNGAGALAILSVKTDTREYQFELMPGSPRDAPSIVRFAYGRSPLLPGLPNLAAAPESSNWRLSGDKGLFPGSIRDDGHKTYLTWPNDQAMPAVFAIGPGGKEEMVEGYVRAGAFTIDRVYERLTFRIDRRTAKARRLYSDLQGQP